MKKLLILITILISSKSYASGLKTEADTKNLCVQAAKQFGTGKVKESFNTLKEFWPLPEQEIDNLSYQTTSQLQMVGGRFGELLGSDYISTQKAGNTFVKHTYVIKYQNHALRYICTFYKPKDLWVINSLTWDDETSLLFQ